MTSRRTLTALVLLAWGAFLAWMSMSGAIVRFLGPRTYWVAWFGAAASLLAGAGTAFHARKGRGPGARRSDIAGVVVMLLPLAVVLALPEPKLGALAASKKAAGVGALASFVPPPRSDGGIGLSEIHFASLSREYADAVGIVEGAEVELIGFVTRPKQGPEGTFSLTRFYIACCAADAVPYSARVRSDEDFPEDTWLRVTGTLTRDGHGFVVEPDGISSVDEPKNPYLY